MKSFQKSGEISGVGFQSEGTVKGSISSGQTGDLLVVPAVSGKVYRLKLLSCVGAASQAGITLETNAGIVESVKTLEGANNNTTASSSFNIMQGRDKSTPNFEGTYEIVECNSFTVNKDGGNTTQSITFAYEIGEYN